MYIIYICIYIHYTLIYIYIYIYIYILGKKDLAKLTDPLSYKEKKITKLKDKISRYIHF